jgi:thiamine-phosphate pyrophosphorylase
VRPIPRLHAITEARLLTDPDLGRKAAAIAALGPGSAIHLRDRGAALPALAEVGRRLAALTRPAESALVVSGRADLARALGAQGVQLGEEDLPVAAARAVLGAGWVGRSVHSVEGARRAFDEGADYVILGSIYPTPSHPDRAPLGPGALEEAARLGRPVVAIGGVTAERASECRRAGAWGVAAIRALWDAADPYAAARQLLEPWGEGP